MIPEQGEDAHPELIKNIIIDKVTSLTVSQAVVAALYAREKSGEGQHIEVSMLDTGINFMGTEYADYALQDSSITPPSSGIGGQQYRTRSTTDGNVVLNLSTNSTWPRMQKAFPEFEWTKSGGKWDSFEARQANMREFAREVEGSLAMISTADAVRRMRENDLPGSHVLTMEEIHEDPQVQVSSQPIQSSGLD